MSPAANPMPTDSKQGPIVTAHDNQLSAQIIAFKALPDRKLPLRRPRLLVRAAREGQATWRRERDLPALFGGDPVPPPGLAVGYLSQLEADLDAARREDVAYYPLARHVAVLIALLSELRLSASHAEQGCPAAIGD